MTTWNERLALACKMQGIKKSELARLIGVSAPTAGDWLNGDIKNLEAENLLKICDNLHISPTWLVKGRGEMKSCDSNAPTLLNIQEEAIELLSNMDRDDMIDWLDTIRIAANKTRKQKQDAADLLPAHSRAAKASQLTEDSDRTLAAKPRGDPLAGRRSAT